MGSSIERHGESPGNYCRGVIRGKSEKEGKDVDFSFSEIIHFIGEYAKKGFGRILKTPFSDNIYRVIMIFREFFWSDPLPTREK
jgi:hypothetical protein